MLSPEEPIRADRQTVRRTFDYRSAVVERRQTILQQKQHERQLERDTDALPGIDTEALEIPRIGSGGGRQVALLREENKRLQAQLESVRAELQHMSASYATLKDSYEKELAAIHSGQQQELDQYHGQLQEAIGERNHLKESYFQLEQRYQELYHEFQAMVDEEARKVAVEAAKTLILAPDEAPESMRDVMKTIELHAQQVEDKQLVEVMYLKREVQRLGDQLTRERQELEQERLHLLRMQQTVREQADLRQKVIQTRLRARWTMGVAFVTLMSLVLLVVLQSLFLWIDHVPFTPPLDFAIFAPILFGVIFSLVFSHPISLIRSIYKSAPHKKTVKK